MSTLPVPHDPGCVSANICADLVGLELPACVLLRGGERTGMNHIIDGLLLPPAHDDRAHVDFDPQVFYGGVRDRDFPAPSAPPPRLYPFLLPRPTRQPRALAKPTH